MDIRVKKSKQKIIDAFMSLRAKKPIEKISVAEICRKAQINKSTFYAHYHNIYDLSERLETELVEEIVASINRPEDILENPKIFTEELFEEYVAKQDKIDILFSGTRSVLLPQKTETTLKNLIYKLHPEYINDIEKNVMLSFKIYGGFYAFKESQKYDKYQVISIIGKLSEQ